MPVRRLYPKKPPDTGVKSSQLNPAVRTEASPPRPDSTVSTRNNTSSSTTPPRLLKDYGGGSRPANVDYSTGAVRGSRLTPQPLPKGRAGGARRSGEEGRDQEGNGSGAGESYRVVGLHRGLVITDELRKELLNPLAHRFKLLRGAH